MTESRADDERSLGTFKGIDCSGFRVTLVVDVGLMNYGEKNLLQREDVRLCSHFETVEVIERDIFARGVDKSQHRMIIIVSQG